MLINAEIPAAWRSCLSGCMVRLSALCSPLFELKFSNQLLVISYVM